MFAAVPVAAGLVAAAASAAPWGTLGRLAVAVTFPLAVLALVHHEGRRGAGTVTVATLAFWWVAWLHVLTTTSIAAWAVDSHMVPWAPIPGPTARVVLAWLCPIGWFAVVALAARVLHHGGAARTVTVVLVVVAVLPMFDPDGFPVDGYAVLWDHSAFTHPTYTAATLAFLLAAGLLLRGRRQVSTEPGQPEPAPIPAGGPDPRPPSEPTSQGGQGSRW